MHHACSHAMPHAIPHVMRHTPCLMPCATHTLVFVHLPVQHKEDKEGAVPDDPEQVEEGEPTPARPRHEEQYAISRLLLGWG